jgi:hypothetical protein
MGYFAPIFAFGQTGLRLATAGSEPSSGSNIIAIDNGDSFYNVGDHVFVSESDDSVPQYFGVVRTATSTQLTMELNSASNYTTDAKVWQPTRYYRFTIGPGYGELRRYRPGVKTRQTRGGQVYSTRISDPVDQVSFEWRSRGRGPAAGWVGVRDFLDDYRDGGLQSFSLGWWDHNYEEIRCSQCRQLFRQIQEEDQPSVLDSEVVGRLLDPTLGRSEYDFAVYLESLSGYVKA